MREDRKKSENEIIVVGSTNYDMFSYVERFPKPGETIAGTNFVTGFGGKGANQAVCCSILGKKVAFVGAVGNDTFGKSMLDNFKENNVDISYTIVDKEKPSGIAAITVDKNGENNIIVVAGANGSVSANHLEKAKDLFKTAKVLICQNEICFDVTKEALKTCKEVNEKVITLFNPSPWQKMKVEDFSCVDVLVVNVTELEDLRKTLSINTEDLDIRNTVKAICDFMPFSCLIVTQGKDGCLVHVKENDKINFKNTPCEKVNGPRVAKSEVVDTTGAGDCFLGALAVGLCNKLDLVSCCEKACEIAGESVKKRGCQESYKGLVFA